MDNGEAPVKNYPFRWKYIILPLSVLLFSIILTAIFYAKLPSDVAYLFQDDGSPDKLLNRGTIVIWMLVLQLVLVLVAGAVTLGIVSLTNRYVQVETSGLKAGNIIALMGNMIAVPQIIIFFAMLDIFSYNSYKIHLLPLWLIAVIVLIIGGIILSIFFIRAMLQTWRTSKE